MYNNKTSLFYKYMDRIWNSWIQRNSEFGEMENKSSLYSLFDITLNALDFR